MSISSDRDDEDTKLPTVVEMAAIPRLATLYSKGIIKRAANSRYPAKASWLDRVCLYQGDITTLAMDSIVNAANRSLLGGGGVDGTIHRAAGNELLAECGELFSWVELIPCLFLIDSTETLGGCETGEAKITKGYKLPSKHIIHAVGPIYSSSKVDSVSQLLASCYRNSLRIASENKLKHIAFPSISTGIYGYPIDDATHIALNEVRQYLDENDQSSLEQVVFVVWSNKDKDVYENLVPQYFPPLDVEPEA